MREPGEYGNDEVPIPVFYVLEIYQETFRHEKPVVEIHTAEPLSPISVGDYLYEVGFSRSAGGASRSYFAGGGKAACDLGTQPADHVPRAGKKHSIIRSW